MTRHVLVTGGAGFIGSHLVDAYLERGYRVSVVDDLSTGSRENVDPRAEFHHADIREFDLRPLRPDIVSHHAAQMDVRRSVADPQFDAEVNIIGSLRLLRQCVEVGVSRFIFASSGGAIYGEPESVPQDENHSLRPMSPYGCAKLAVEFYMNYFRQVHGLSTVALRYANIYGPRQNPHGEAGVVAIFIERLLRGEQVTINGDGEQTRDYVYVDDVVAANMAVSETSEGSFNVGTGVETSVNALYREIQQMLGAEREPFHAPAKAGEQMRSVLDGSALRAAARLTEPKHLRKGLRLTAEWFSRLASRR